MNINMPATEMRQYRDPFSFELAQQSFRFAMDEGSIFVISFADGHSLFTADMGCAATLAHYDCMKAAPEVYLVNFEQNLQAQRINTTLVLDLAERLVTRVRTTADPGGDHCAMVDSRIDFGVIDRSGFTCPTKRHRYTTMLMGKCVSLCASPEHRIVQLFDSTETIRARAAGNCAWGQLSADEWSVLDAGDGYGEAADYIKIKDGLYLVAYDEKNLIRAGSRGVSQLLLMDTRRILCVGRIFGCVSYAGGEWEELNYLFNAHGDFINPADYEITQ